MMTGRPARIVAAYAAALSLTTPAFAKTPGEVHCYNGICHRVKTVEEMRLLLGQEIEAVTSFYDSAERDRMNAGTITSSGEEFDADSESHAASSLYPDGTELLIWNPKNRHAAHIRVNDFGPFYMLRTIDVTRGVAERLEFTKTGVARLKVFVVWAPDTEDARFRRRRIYAPVEGYIGRLDADQLMALKARLMATAPARNGRAPIIAFEQGAAEYRTTLPAFDRSRGTNDRHRLAAAILNTPRQPLAAIEPAFVMHEARTPAATVASDRRPAVRARGSALAIAASSRPAIAVVTARDVEVAEAAATLEPAPQSSPAVPASVALPTSVLAKAPDTLPAPIVRSLGNDGSGRSVPRESSVWRSLGPSAMLWQQLLVAIGVLSAAAIGWRTRSASSAKRAHMTIEPPPFLRGSAPPNPAGSNVVSLPQLPGRRQRSRSLEVIASDALAHMEAYAYGRAEACYRELIEARTEAFGANGPATASAERLLADCLREQGRYAAAEPHYRRALDGMRLSAGEQHPATADILDEFALSTLRRGFGAEAERLARQALAIRRTIDPGSREHAVTRSIVAEAMRAQGQLMSAEAEHRLAWGQFIVLSGEESLDAAASMTSLGAVLGELQRFAAAEELLNAGTRILSAACGPDHAASATGYGLLGDFYRRAGALDAAHTMQNYALSIRGRVLGDNHPDTIENLLSLAVISTEQFKMDEARGYLNRALDNIIEAERQSLGPQSRMRSLLVALSAQHQTASASKLAAE